MDFSAPHTELKNRVTTSHEKGRLQEMNNSDTEIYEGSDFIADSQFEENDFEEEELEMRGTFKSEVSTWERTSKKNIKSQKVIDMKPDHMNEDISETMFVVERAESPGKPLHYHSCRRDGKKAKEYYSHQIYNSFGDAPLTETRRS